MNSHERAALAAAIENFEATCPGCVAAWDNLADAKTFLDNRAAIERHLEAWQAVAACADVVIAAAAGDETVAAIHDLSNSAPRTITWRRAWNSILKNANAALPK